MNAKELAAKIEGAPVDVQKEVLNFLEYLLSKEKNQEAKSERVVRKSGFGKGTFTNIADDFDAPLDDLKDYM